MPRLGTNDLIASVAALPELGDHTDRVASLAVGLLGQLPENSMRRREQILLAARIHDLGKLAIPTAILSKPAALTATEYAIVQRHSAISDAVARSTGVDPEVCLAIRHHHEWWDGNGYPDRLSGDAIPLLARIIAIADAFDAMISDRPYRNAMSVEAARRELERGSGSQFDPALVPYVGVVLATSSATGGR
ncbi:MAG: HD domain-containing protein [Thermomicrobiales bacterium]